MIMKKYIAHRIVKIRFLLLTSENSFVVTFTDMPERLVSNDYF